MSVAQPRHTTKQPSISRESTNCEIAADCFPSYAASAAGNLTPTWVSAISAFGNVPTELSHRSFKFGSIEDFVGPHYSSIIGTSNRAWSTEAQ